MKKENDLFNKIEIDIIDEDREPARAAKYQYKLVPNFWVGDEKALEGIPSTGTVREVLELALDGEEDQLSLNSRYEDEYTEGTAADTTDADTALPDDIRNLRS